MLDCRPGLLDLQVRGELGPHCCAGDCGEGSGSRCWWKGVVLWKGTWFGLV